MHRYTGPAVKSAQLRAGRLSFGMVKSLALASGRLWFKYQHEQADADIPVRPPGLRFICICYPGKVIKAVRVNRWEFVTCPVENPGFIRGECLGAGTRSLCAFVRGQTVRFAAVSEFPACRETSLMFFWFFRFAKGCLSEVCSAGRPFLRFTSFAKQVIFKVWRNIRTRQSNLHKKGKMPPASAVSALSVP